jgi:hypothetical protein
MVTVEGDTLTLELSELDRFTVTDETAACGSVTANAAD